MRTPQQAAVQPEAATVPSDLAGWQHAVRNGSFRDLRLENIVAAIQDFRKGMDKPTLHALARHLSDCMMGILRRRVDFSLPNQGNDIIQEVHSRLWLALLDPESADGKGLREAFTPRVEFRIKDEIVRLAREGRKESGTYTHNDLANDDDPSSQAAPLPFHPSETRTLDEQMDVEAALAHIGDPLKRQAFRLYMEGVPFKSKKGVSIEKVVGRSERTVREWIKEAQEILKQHMGDVS